MHIPAGTTSLENANLNNRFSVSNVSPVISLPPDVAKLKIYLSYPRRSKREDFWKIGKTLSAYGFQNVWLDKTERFSKGFFDDIYQAIEESAVFIMFYNKTYRVGQIGRREAIYADKLNKPVICVNMEPKKSDVCGWAEFMFKTAPWLHFKPNKTNVKDLVDKIATKLTWFVKKGDLVGPPSNSHISENCQKTIFVEMPISDPKTYHEREEDEAKILQALGDICKDPCQGMMAVGGESGVGKTTTMSQLLYRESSSGFLLEKCKIGAIVWLNCFRWRNSSSLEIAKEFTKEICRKSEEAIRFEESAHFDSLTAISNYFDKNVGSKILLVLDDVFSYDLLKIVEKNCRNVPCCAILHDESLNLNGDVVPTFVRHKIGIEPMNSAEIRRFFDSAPKLQHLLGEQVDFLTQMSNGMPLVAGLIANIFDDFSDANDVHSQWKALKEKLTVGNQPNDQFPGTIIQTVLEIGINRLPEIRNCFFAFLFFDPEEPISPDDLALFWGLAPGEEIAMCWLFKQHSHVTAVKEFSLKKSNFLMIHKRLHETAQQMAEAFFGIDPNCTSTTKRLSKIRLKLLTGGALRNDRQNVNILAQLIASRRRNLVEKALDRLAVEDLAELARAKLPEQNGRTFLRSLYSAEFDETVVNKHQPSESVNHAYRLVDKLLAKLISSGENVLALVQETDDSLNSLLVDVFDDSNVVEFSSDRNKILSKIRRLKADYVGAKWERDKFRLCKYKKLINAARCGLLSEICQTLSTSSHNLEGMLDLLPVALHCASRHGHLGAVAMLLDNYSELAEKLPVVDLSTSFMFAASNGHVDICEKLSQLDPRIGCFSDDNGMTGLMLAASGGHFDVVEFICKNYPEQVSEKDNSGKSAFTYACELGDVQIAEFLRSLWPDCVFQIDKEGYTPIKRAIANYNLPVAVLISTKNENAIKVAGNDFSNLMAAALTGNLTIVKFIYESCSDAIELRTENGWSTLMFAVKSGNFETSHFIYEKLPEAVDWQANDGTTALIVAAVNGNLDTVRFLYEKMNPQVRQVKSGGYTAFGHAAKNGNFDVVKYYVYKEPSIWLAIDQSCGNNLGFIGAVVHGHREIVEFLYAKNRDFVKWQKINDNESPLALAASNGHLKICEFLRSACQCNEQLKRATLIAAKNRNLPITLFLATSVKSDLEKVIVMEKIARAGFVDAFRELSIVEPSILTAADSEGRTAVFFAAGAGHHDLVEFFVTRDLTQVLQRTKRNAHPLHYACLSGKSEVISFLFEKFKTATCKVTDLNETPLWFAAGSNGCPVEVCRFLYDHYPEAAYQRESVNGSTPIMAAAKAGNVDVVRWFFEAAGDDSEKLLASPKTGTTALMVAASKGRLETVDFLVKQLGASTIRQKRADGQTAVMLAAKGGSVDVVKSLYEKDSLVFHDVDNDGRHAIFLAIEANRLAVVQFIVQTVGAKFRHEKGGHGTLTLAAKLGHLKIAQVLYESSPELADERTPEGDTALLLATSNGFSKTAQFLAERRPDLLKIPNNKGEIPLFKAVEKSNSKLVGIFVENDRETVDIPNNDGLSAVDLASIKGQWDIFKVLINETADKATQINKTFKQADDRTVLFKAAQTGRLDVVEWLFEHCGDDENMASVKDRNKRVPISVAAENGHLEVVKFLDQKFADGALIRDVNDKSAVTWSVVENKAPVVEYFLSTREDVVKIVDVRGCNLLMIAALNSSLGIVEMIHRKDEEALQTKTAESHGATAMHLAAVAGNVDALAYFHSCDETLVLACDDDDRLPVAYADIGEKSRALSYLQQIMSTTPISQLLSTCWAGNLIAWGRSRTLTPNQWEQLLEPALNLVKVPITNLSESDLDYLLCSLSSIWTLTDNNKQFSLDFIEAGGLSVVVRLLTTMRKFLETAAAPENRSNGNAVIDELVGILVNVAEVPNLAARVAVSDLLHELKLLMRGNAIKRPRPWLAALAVANLISNSDNNSQVEAAANAALDELNKRVKIWTDEGVGVRGIDFKTFKFFVPMLSGKSPLAVRKFALWLMLRILKSPHSWLVMAQSARLLEREGVLALVERLTERSNHDELTAKFANKIVRWSETGVVKSIIGQYKRQRTATNKPA